MFSIMIGPLPAPANCCQAQERARFWMLIRHEKSKRSSGGMISKSAAICRKSILAANVSRPRSRLVLNEVRSEVAATLRRDAKARTSPTSRRSLRRRGMIQGRGQRHPRRRAAGRGGSVLKDPRRMIGDCGFRLAVGWLREAGSGTRQSGTGGGDRGTRILPLRISQRKIPALRPRREMPPCSVAPFPYVVIKCASVALFVSALCSPSESPHGCDPGGD